jgi:hypothetical protein
MQKSRSLERGKRLLNVRTPWRPSYGVEATSLELIFGMAQICTSGMAARGEPWEHPPMAHPDTRQLTNRTLMTN